MKKLSRRLAFRSIAIRPLAVTPLHGIAGGIAKTGYCTIACTIGSCLPLCATMRDDLCGGPTTACLTPAC
jgi:hypothetical protein